MDEEPGATCRYYCHICSLIVRPELGVEVVTCPRCRSGFVEEMADGRRSSNATTESGAHDPGARPDHAVQPWPPILMDLLGVSYGPDAGDAAAVGDLTLLARRQYRQLAFLQLLNALQDGDADGNATDTGLVLVSPTDAHAMLMPERGGSNGAGTRAPGLTLGELILGPGLDLLLEYLAETDPSRQGTLPAKKEAVAAMPTVKIREVAPVTCPVCLDEFEPGGEAREMPCKHRFHNECIVPWLEAHSSCPVCRFQLPTDEAAVTEPVGSGNGGDEEIADASSAGSANDGGAHSDGGGSGGRRRWLARPLGRLFSRRWNGSSSSSSSR